MILDASTLLAFLHDEPGGDDARRALADGVISTVNWAEVVQKALKRGADIDGMQEEFEEYGLVFAPFTTKQAELAARLWSKTRRHGLSLADRACIALAMERQLPILTADRVWTELDLSVEIRPLR
uniref:PIN domain nuclease, a component of toxin-antitoxin system (PIN domain) n=1 Tax=Candidatus Kentrum sp. DK TaxID=2126562 RepID=A0A450RVE7_9GAMM|nr:MAG: PIN domain nuclease, a component of toxin-antitoxin system (PIN domain) [Candidatus Kentron sp. DK]